MSSNICSHFGFSAEPFSRERARVRTHPTLALSRRDSFFAARTSDSTSVRTRSPRARARGAYAISAALHRWGLPEP